LFFNKYYSRFAIQINTMATSKTKIILHALHVIAWLAFIGFMIEAGAALVSFVVGCIRPELVKNLYHGQNWSDLMSLGIMHYFFLVSFLLVVLSQKAYVSWLAIKTLTEVNLEQPFTIRVVKLLERIANMIIGMAIVSIVHNLYLTQVLRTVHTTQAEWATGEYLFMAGIVYLISQLFRRGVEIQSENELTV
jgi:hypothetical protein